MSILRESGQRAVRVGKLALSGPVHRTQCIHEGDQIIQVDGTSTEGMDYNDVLTLLRQVGNTFTLVVIANKLDLRSRLFDVAADTPQVDGGISSSGDGSAAGVSGAGSDSGVRGRANGAADSPSHVASLNDRSNASKKNDAAGNHNGVPADLKTRVVVIERSSALIKLGMTVKTVEELRGARITKLAPGSPCDVGGNLHIGTVIVKIDGEVVLDLDHADIIKRLQQTGSIVRLVIADPPRDQTPTRAPVAAPKLTSPSSTSGMHWQTLFSSPTNGPISEAVETPVVRFAEPPQQEQYNEKQVEEHNHQPQQRQNLSSIGTGGVGILLPASSKRRDKASFDEGPYAVLRTRHIRNTSKMQSVPVESSFLSAGSSDTQAPTPVSPATGAGAGAGSVPSLSSGMDPRLTLAKQLEAAEEAYKASQGMFTTSGAPQLLPSPAPITVERSAAGAVKEPTPGVGVHKRVNISRLPGEKLGLKIRSFLNNTPGVYVSEVTHGGPCFRSNGVGVHDTIVEVNGKSVRSMQYRSVLQLLQASGAVLELALTSPATASVASSSSPMPALQLHGRAAAVPLMSATAGVANAHSTLGPGFGSTSGNGSTTAAADVGDSGGNDGVGAGAGAGAGYSSQWVVSLKKAPDENLGFKIRSFSNLRGVRVFDVIPGSLADRTGQIKIGNILLEIDGNRVIDTAHDEVLELLRSASNQTLNLVFGEAVNESEERIETDEKSSAVWPSNPVQRTTSFTTTNPQKKLNRSSSTGVSPRKSLNTSINTGGTRHEATLRTRLRRSENAPRSAEQPLKSALSTRAWSGGRARESKSKMRRSYSAYAGTGSSHPRHAAPEKQNNGSGPFPSNQMSSMAMKERATYNRRSERDRSANVSNSSSNNSPAPRRRPPRRADKGKSTREVGREDLAHFLPTRRITVFRAPSEKLGLTIRSEGENRGVFVSGVLPNSPSSRTGITVNETIAEINNENVLDLGHDAVLERLQAAGNTIEMLLIGGRRGFGSAINLANISLAPQTIFATVMGAARSQLSSNSNTTDPMLVSDNSQTATAEAAMAAEAACLGYSGRSLNTSTSSIHRLVGTELDDDFYTYGLLGTSINLADASVDASYGVEGGPVPQIEWQIEEGKWRTLSCAILLTTRLRNPGETTTKFQFVTAHDFRMMRAANLMDKSEERSGYAYGRLKPSCMRQPAGVSTSSSETLYPRSRIALAQYTIVNDAKDGASKGDAVAAADPCGVELYAKAKISVACVSKIVPGGVLAKQTDIRVDDILCVLTEDGRVIRDHSDVLAALQSPLNRSASLKLLAIRENPPSSVGDAVEGGSVAAAAAAAAAAASSPSLAASPLSSPVPKCAVAANSTNEEVEPAAASESAEPLGRTDARAPDSVVLPRSIVPTASVVDAPAPAPLKIQEQPATLLKIQELILAFQNGECGSAEELVSKIALLT